MEKNYIVIDGLERSSPAEFTPLQEALLPHVPNIELFWSVVWGLTLLYMAYRYIVRPLYLQVLKK